MTMRTILCRKNLFVALCCAVMIVGVSAASVIAQDNVQRPTGSAVRSGPPACSLADKVAVTSFTLSSSAEPLVGESINAKLQFRNNCPAGTAALRVPWEILRNSSRIGSGTETLAPGASSEVSVISTAVPGAHNFYGSVRLTDGGNNNTSDDRAVTVMQEISLNHNSVQGSGAQFAHNVQPLPSPLPPPNCIRLGQFNANDSTLLLNGRSGVVFAADCQNTGGKADPEAFKNLTLRNGWTVKSAEVVETNIPDRRNAGFSQMTMPSPGSTNPFTKFHVWANSRGRVYVRVVIVIRGPADKNPFQ